MEAPVRSYYCELERGYHNFVFLHTNIMSIIKMYSGNLLRDYDIDWVVKA